MTCVIQRSHTKSVILMILFLQYNAEYHYALIPLENLHFVGKGATYKIPS